MQGLTFSLNKNWKKNPKVLSDQVVFLFEEVFMSVRVWGALLQLHSAGRWREGNSL